MAAMFNLPENEDMSSKMENLKEITEQVNTQFKDPDLTTFVCVCIPEVFLAWSPSWQQQSH